jgi:ABC-2 type transport system permease protein
MSAVAVHARRIAAIARRDLRSERSYRFRQILILVEIAVSGLIAFHVAKLIDDPPELAAYRGTYFDFAMVGLAVLSVASLGISTFNANIQREQSLGTFEVLLATPTPMPVLLAGSFVYPLMLTALDVTLYFGICIGLFGTGLTVVGTLLAVPLLALTLACFCAFGIAGAALVVLVKRGDPLTGPLTQATTILSGALFPVSVFPTAIEWLARAFPAYYGITGLREAMLGRGGWRDVLPDIAVLACFAAVLLPVSMWCFSRAVDAARRAGTLGNY